MGRVQCSGIRNVTTALYYAPTPRRTQAVGHAKRRVEKRRKKEREDECMLLKLACVVLMPAQLQAELRYKNESILDKCPHFHV